MKTKKPVISTTDLAMLKLSYAQDIELFEYLELALRDNPALVQMAVKQCKPKDFSDTAAWDRVLASLDTYAREFYTKYNILPEWADEWFAKFYPNTHTDYYDHKTIFGGDVGVPSRFDGISCVVLW